MQCYSSHYVEIKKLSQNIISKCIYLYIIFNAQGPNGEDGRNGLDGIPGRFGEKGIPGMIGKRGKPGKLGLPGMNATPYRKYRTKMQISIASIICVGEFKKKCRS